MARTKEKHPRPREYRSPALRLSVQDKRHLEQLEAKFQLVRDRTTRVALGYTTGLFLFGKGGVGKRSTWFHEAVTIGSQAARKQQKLEIAREIQGLSREERLQAWMERTGKSEPALYRRLSELKAGPFSDSQIAEK